MKQTDIYTEALICLRSVSYTHLDVYKRQMYWSRDLHLLRVPLEVPPQYTLVGTLPPFTDQPCRSYGGWSDGYDAVSYTHLDVSKRQIKYCRIRGTFHR